MDDTPSLLRALLAYVWAPALALAGVLDWTLHRQQRIELTAGLKESALHLVMIAAVGSGLLAALMLQTEPPDWSWRWAESPPPAAYVGTLLAAALVLNILPFAEESWRCLRAAQRR